MKPSIVLVSNITKQRDAWVNALKVDFEIKEVVSSGKAALEAIGRHAPQLVVTEMAFSDFSAIEITKTLTENGSATKVVVLSGVKNEQIVLHAFEAGVLDYIFLPVRDEALVRQLISCLVPR